MAVMESLKQESGLWEWAASYTPTEPWHRTCVERFRGYVDATPALKAHRDLCEREVYGFGDRSFHWLWKLLYDELPHDFKFLEIGVYKGQVVSLLRLLAGPARGRIYGITPLSAFSGVTGQFYDYPTTDYRQHIATLHNIFDLQQPELLPLDSTDPVAVMQAQARGPFDAVYIDGCHEYAYVEQDLRNYAPLVKRGGFLVMDDASCDLQMPFGYFCGVQDVTRALADHMQKHGAGWRFCLAVIHLKVFQRK
jgi:hypothetical protein